MPLVCMILCFLKINYINNSIYDPKSIFRISDHPDFSKRFFLLGENPEKIKFFFTDELVLFLESNPYYHIECNSSSLLVMRKERLASIKKIKA